MNFATSSMYVCLEGVKLRICSLQPPSPQLLPPCVNHSHPTPQPLDWLRGAATSRKGGQAPPPPKDTTMTSFSPVRERGVYFFYYIVVDVEAYVFKAALSDRLQTHCDEAVMIRRALGANVLANKLHTQLKRRTVSFLWPNDKCRSDVHSPFTPKRKNMLFFGLKHGNDTGNCRLQFHIIGQWEWLGFSCIDGLKVPENLRNLGRESVGSQWDRQH